MEFLCASNEEPNPTQRFAVRQFTPSRSASCPGRIDLSLPVRRLGVLLARGGRRIMARKKLSPPEEYAMPAKKLSDSEIATLLPKAKGWSVANGKLHREFACKDFVTAFGNMTRVALVAEAMNHHPEWFNVWNKVVIDLNTHSVKGISDYDFVLAEKINEIFGA
jgi:4a-hydroxytetrahydrobiopterin dehydratase